MFLMCHHVQPGNEGVIPLLKLTEMLDNLNDISLITFDFLMFNI
jgi:hypothetical protein